MDGINTQWMQHQKISKFLSMENIYQVTLHTPTPHSLQMFFLTLEALTLSAITDITVLMSRWPPGGGGHWTPCHQAPAGDVMSAALSPGSLCTDCVTITRTEPWHWTLGAGCETGAGGWSRPAWPPLRTRGLLCTRGSWSFQVTFH